MPNDILSQDEVDALLRGMTGGDLDFSDDEAEESGPIRAYDLASQDRIVRGRMPTLEVINERFARLLRVSIFNFLRRAAEISVGQVRLLKYGEFVRNLVVPSNLNLVHMRPLRGTALMIFDPKLIFSVVDNFFGGDGRFHTRIEGRDFTPVEQRIIKRMLEMVMKDLQDSWHPVLPVEFEFSRWEVNPQFASIATPSEVVVVTTFSLELDGGGGDIHICMPYSMIEPIRDQLVAGMASDRIEVDHRWINALREEMQEATVTMHVNFTNVSLTVRQILEMEVGDVIPIEMPEILTATADDVPVLQGACGVSNDKYALKVTKITTPKRYEKTMGTALREAEGS